MKQFNKSFFRSFYFNWDDIVALLGRKSRQPLMKIILNMSLLVGGHKTISLIKGIYLILTALHHLLKEQGIPGTVKYCKGATVVLQQMIAGYRISDLSDIGPRFSRTRAGLPRILPSLWRREIRSGNVFYMRLSLTILNIYRVMEFEGPLKIKTITDEPGFNHEFMMDLENYVEPYLVSVKALASFMYPLDLLNLDKRGQKLGKFFKIFPIMKSSPTVIRNDLSNYSSSRYSIFRACQTILTIPPILDAVRAFIDYYDVMPVSKLDKVLMKNDLARGHDDKLEEISIHPSRIRDIYEGVKGFNFWNYAKSMSIGFKPETQRFIILRNETYEIIGDVIPIKGPTGKVFSYKASVIRGSSWEFQTTISRLGKLGTKIEPAGKVRVFAMVDCITQWVLRPIHKAIFKILKTIPMDGTFNQLKPINRLFRSDLRSGLFSFDLSAATDRLPVILQEAILAPLIGYDLARHWTNLLVGRAYYLKDKPIFYSTGQPMGALSSWAMLAFTHHFLVQVSAWKAKVVPIGKLFKAYALLGDDIVIAHSGVAREYLNIMKMIDVPINKSKSIISKNGLGLEFAKRTFFKGQDVSPVPFREFSEASTSLTSFVELTRKYSVSYRSVLQIMGYGYKVLSSADLPASRLSGRYRWVKVLMTFPTDQASLRSWVSDVASPSVFWGILATELTLILKSQVDLVGWKSLVRSEGFKPRVNSPQSRSFPSFWTAQSLTVSNRIRDLVRDLNNQTLELSQIIDDFSLGKNPDLYMAFKAMLKCHRTLSLLTVKVDQSNLLIGSKKKLFRVKSRNAELWKRWIRILQPRPAKKAIVPVQ